MTAEFKLVTVAVSKWLVVWILAIIIILECFPVFIAFLFLVVHAYIDTSFVWTVIITHAFTKVYLCIRELCNMVKYTTVGNDISISCGYGEKFVNNLEFRKTFRLSDFIEFVDKFKASFYIFKI